MKMSPYMKRWWSKELTVLKKQKEYLERKSYRKRACNKDPIHKEFRQAWNKYSEAIWKTKEEHWVEWLEMLDEEGMWSVNCMVSGVAMDRGRCRMLTLQVKDPITKQVIKEAWSNKEKGQLLWQVFFPKETVPPALNTGGPHAQAKCKYSPITDEQIHQAINCMKPWKATQSEMIPNAVFIHAWELLVPYLGPIFRATDSLKTYPEDRKLTKTLILKKPSKPDYMSTGTWRPIVLSNRYARLLTSCKLEDLMLMCNKTRILPLNHFRGRQGRATTDSIHLVVKLVKDGWRKGEVASLLCLNVKAAFPSTMVDVLIQEMRGCGIPEGHVEWFERRLDKHPWCLTTSVIYHFC